MAYNTFTPMFISRTEARRTRSLITAAEWNELFNLNITQGDHSEQYISELCTFLFGEDGVSGFTGNSTADIDAINLHLQQEDTLIQGLQDYLRDLQATQVAINTIAGYIGTNVQAMLETITGNLTNQSNALSTALENMTINEETGDITVYRKNGTSFVLQTNLEYVVQNYEYDAATESMVLIYPDGRRVSIPMSAFISEYDFTNSDSIVFTVTNHKVTATLSPTYYNSLTQLKDSAEAAAVNAGSYASDARGYSLDASVSAVEAQSYAKGGTSTRTGEDTDNAKYYKEQAATQALSASGSANAAANSATAAAGSATSSASSADEAEAWANGTVDGTPVPTTHPAHNNNSKYWKDQAEQIAGGDYATHTELNAEATARSEADIALGGRISDEVLARQTADTAIANAIPTALSQLSEDSTHRLVTDSDKSAWNGKADVSNIPTMLKQLLDDAEHRLVTDTEKSAWDAKQAALEFTSTPSSNNKVVCEDDVPSGGASLDNLAYVEGGTTATKAYVAGEYLVYDGKLYKTKTAIASGATFVVNTNIERTNVGDELIIANKTAHVVEIKSSGTWTVPDGVTEVDVFLVGAGQDGSAGGFDNKTSVGGGTGGAGGKIVRIDGLKVVPNENIAVSIGTNGADTTFGALSSANGTYQAGAGSSQGINTVSVNQFCPWTGKLYGIGGACGGWAHASSSDMSSNGDGWGVAVSFGENIAKSGGAKSTLTISSSNYYCNGGGGASASNNGGDAYISRYADVTYGGNGGDGGANTGHGGGGGGGTISSVYGTRSGVASTGGTGGSGIVIVHYYK